MFQWRLIRFERAPADISILRHLFFLKFSLVLGLDYGGGRGGGGGDGCADGCGDGGRQVKGKKSSGVDGQEIEGQKGSTGRQVM